MSFRLFGVNVEIQMGFWITAVLLGWPASGTPDRLIVVWVAVVLLSVLVHEFGHAMAVMRHHIEPEITLHWMGGTTAWRPILPLRRRDHVLISAAGPAAGFALWGALRLLGALAPGLYASLPMPVYVGLQFLEDVNLAWSIFNLIPVLPLDGGHILEHALGPRRVRLAAGISLGVASLLILFFLSRHSYWGVFLFGMAAMQNVQRLRAEGPAPRHRPDVAPARPQEAALPAAVVSLLRQAEAALADEEPTRARALAEQVLGGAGSPAELGGEAPPEGPPPAAARAAHEIIAWSRLLEERVDDAQESLDRARRLGEVDPALAGAVLLARGKTREARAVLEAARAAGDDRKVIVGPLIQVLLAEGEVARAAATALDIVDQLSEEDARKMAAIAFEAGTYEWAARLSEVVFSREGQPDDAYDAARAHARAGDNDLALDLLRRAVAAGFTDAPRAWSDAAFAALRVDHGLEAVLPRPEKA
jgi:Zn-dependent protease